jgi:O-antigen/teichoic acid export membrane protein
MLFIYDTVTLAGAPVFSSIYVGGDRHELQRFTRLATRTVFWLSLPLYAVLIFFAPWFLSFFGVEFVNGANVMRLLATTLFLSSSSGFVQLMLYAVGCQREVAIAMGITAAINVGLCLVLVPSYGMLGAAVASGTSLLALKGSLVFLLYKKVGIIALPFLTMARQEGKTC